MEGVTCRVVFESVNQYGQTERHVHYTDDYDKAKRDEAALQNRLNWMLPKDKNPDY